jgi:hypothetical protein
MKFFFHAHYTLLLILNKGMWTYNSFKGGFWLPQKLHLQCILFLPWKFLIAHELVIDQ